MSQVILQHCDFSHLVRPNHNTTVDMNYHLTKQTHFGLYYRTQLKSETFGCRSQAVILELDSLRAPYSISGFLAYLVPREVQTTGVLGRNTASAKALIRLPRVFANTNLPWGCPWACSWQSMKLREREERKGNDDPDCSCSCSYSYLVSSRMGPAGGTKRRSFSSGYQMGNEVQAAGVDQLSWMESLWVDLLWRSVYFMCTGIII